MKIIGLVGGIGPESTIEYYRLLLAAWRERRPDGSNPPILINSIDVKKMLDLIGANELAVVTDYLVGEVGRLALAGAEIGLLAANTPHIVFNEIQARSPIPLVSIVEATCAAVKARSFTRVGLFGTRFTGQACFYPDVFGRNGIQIVTPDVEEQDYIHNIYMNELVAGRFLPETRQRVLEIASQLRVQKGIEGLILGGTELPLLLREAEYEGLPMLDTTRIHVEALVAQAWEGIEK
jgi:aspartate racemase